jgi:hypothetical protein
MAHTGRFAALALVVACLGAPVLASCSSSKAAQDVSITACQADPGGGRPTATGTIDNHSSKASTYAVDITFYDSSGNKVTQGGATVGKVESGATSVFHVTGLADAKGPVTCKVSSVTRTVAP